MNAITLPAVARPRVTANAALKASAQLWFLTAVIGQWIFALYVATFYGSTAARGDLQAWNTVLPHGYEPGNSIGNFALGAHLLFAAVITIGGPLQLVPAVRARFPAFHRWSGRLYIVTAFIMSGTGLYLGLSGRRIVGDVLQNAGIEINAVLIMVCAALALRFALARDFRAHRRWALRLFLVVSGVWFFRVGLMLSFAVFGGPFGFDPATFQGPFLTFLSFAQYLLPLGVLEAYFRARESAGPTGRLVMAGVLVALTAAMGVGIFAATLGMWLPRVSGVL